MFYSTECMDIHMEYIVEGDMDICDEPPLPMLPEDSDHESNPPTPPLPEDFEDLQDIDEDEIFTRNDVFANDDVFLFPMLVYNIFSIKFIKQTIKIHVCILIFLI